MRKVIPIIVIAALICAGFFVMHKVSDQKAEREAEKADGQKTEQTAGDKTEKDSKDKKNSNKKEKDSSKSGKTMQECAYTADDPLVIEIDPGHGGSDPGASNTTTGTEIMEKDVNLKIGTALRDELSKYDNVKVYMTREDDSDITITARQTIASESGADLLISLHNNAKGDGFPYTDGCMVLAASGNDKESIAEESQLLGTYITQELESLGIANRGLLLRIAEENTGLKYSNGKLADYYGIVRNALENDMMGIIVEHAYLDDAEDYEAFLSDDGKLEDLAKADARGIAAYYQLEPVLSEEETVQEPMIYMTDDEGENTEYYDEAFDLHQLAE